MERDVSRVTSTFLRQFNAMYAQFNFLSADVLYFLFRTYTSSFYGMHLWIEEPLKSKDLYTLSVAYHKAVKRVAGLTPWDNNHEACSIVGVNTMKHLLAKRMVKFYFRVMSSQVSMIRRLRYHFMQRSALHQTISGIFERVYGTKMVLFNDLQALLARVDFVERTEPRSHYVPAVPD